MRGEPQLSKFRKADPITWGLFLLLVAYLIYDEGFGPGLLTASAFAYMLILFRVGIGVAMGLLMRQKLLDKADRVLLAVAVAYAAASLTFGLPGLVFLTSIGLAGGALFGAVSALSSPYHRWR